MHTAIAKRYGVALGWLVLHLGIQDFLGAWSQALTGQPMDPLNSPEVRPPLLQESLQRSGSWPLIPPIHESRGVLQQQEASNTITQQYTYGIYLDEVLVIDDRWEVSQFGS